MKHIVIGTAGHVDHGKTLLTKTLTGRDTDRLAEEKARGMSIELGFAPMKLPDGTKISIVDVPGHEKFVRTMMSGASGIDGVLLVIAADDGVMPQTTEHLDILRLLGVRSGIVVLSKCDLVEEDRLAEVEAQIRDVTADSFLADAVICPISAVTGQGIPELIEEITKMVAGLQERSGSLPARLPVDRVFQVEGFGAVATGTLTEGMLHLGQEVMIYPQKTEGSIRSIQNHNKAAEEAHAGSRTAISLTAKARDSMVRGSILAVPDSMLVSDMLDVWLQLTPDCPYRIRNSSQLHLFCGTREVVCRIRLLDADYLTAGQSGYAQLKLTEPLAVRCGDRYILRFFSPVMTVGGGVILAAGSKRLRRSHPPVLERLARLNSTDREEAVLQYILDEGLEMADLEHLAKVINMDPDSFGRIVDALREQGKVECLQSGKAAAVSALEDCWKEVSGQLEAFHREYPLQPGMRTARLRSTVFSQKAVPVNLLLDWFIRTGRMTLKDDYAAMPGFEPVFTQEHKIMQRKIQHYYRDAWFLAPDQKVVDKKFENRGELYVQMMANMKLSGKLISLTPRYSVHFEAYAQALELFRGLFETNTTVSLVQFKNAAGISRKYAQLFLEHFDRAGYSRRVGDVRVLLRNSEEE